ncbi:thioredoxin family protein [Microvirga sp. VF16]|uniref:DUF1223 domain-containing protein n=1 Tax=Microvirga sp. VF16 TaxID=2807101 RepID=UPI001FEDF7F8|nr:DUF1223 domain-containing protein [Microvirga sp. VF16]
MKTWLGLLPVLSTLLVGPALASPEPRAVLELFVSQGCSACRPANQLMTELKQDPSLIVLSLPVNYWDYLGWKDTLADPTFTSRQRGYASARRDRQVYTPQMVVNGVLACVGSERNQVARLIETATASHAILPVAIKVSEENGLVIVDIAPGSGTAGVWLLPIRKHNQVAIQRGENAGRTETYTNVVRGFYLLGSWSGAALRVTTPLAAVLTQDADSYVVLLQRADDEKPGLILGAAGRPSL